MTLVWYLLKNLNLPLWNEMGFVCSVTLLKPFTFFGGCNSIGVYGCPCKRNQWGGWQFHISLPFGIGVFYTLGPFHPARWYDVGNWAEGRSSGEPSPDWGRWGVTEESGLLHFWPTFFLYCPSVWGEAAWMPSHSQVFARQCCVPSCVPGGSVGQCIHDPGLLAHGAAPRTKRRQ